MIVLASALTLALFDLDASDGGFVPGGGGQWEWGTPATGPGPGARAWGTRLDGLYLNDTVDTLEVPLPDLSGAARPVVRVEHWWDTRIGDAGWFEIDDGAGFERVEPIHGYPDPAGFTGTSGGWRTTTVDLSAHGPDPSFRLVFAADPMRASTGWYVGEVAVYDGDVTPPVLSPVRLPVDTQDLGGPYVVELDVVDDVALVDVELLWAVDGGSSGATAMVPIGGDRWRGEIPGQPPDTIVRWHALAFDAEQGARWPAASDDAFRVFLAAPTGLAAPAGRVVGPTVRLSWTAPTSPHPVLGYEVFETGVDDRVSVTGTSADVPLRASGTHTFGVVARYAAGIGDASALVTVVAEVPSLDTVDPASAYQGDRVWVDLTGASLYLHDATAALDLGAGVTVESLDVLDAGRAAAVIAVARRAQPGPRDVTVTGSHGTYVFPGAFEVRDGAGRPRVVSVSPDTITQGATVTVTVRTSAPFAGAPQVDPGRDLLVVSDVTATEREVTFELLALGAAVPGERLLVLDDGARLWGAPITVREYVQPIERRCQHVGPGPWWPLLLLLAIRRRG